MHTDSWKSRLLSWKHPHQGEIQLKNTVLTREKYCCSHQASWKHLQEEGNMQRSHICHRRQRWKISLLPDSPPRNLQSEGGWPSEGEEGAGGGLPKEDPIRGGSQGPSGTLAGQAGGDWTRDWTREAQLFSQPGEGRTSWADSRGKHFWDEGISKLIE